MSLLSLRGFSHLMRLYINDTVLTHRNKMECQKGKGGSNACTT